MTSVRRQSFVGAALVALLAAGACSSSPSSPADTTTTTSAPTAAGGGPATVTPSMSSTLTPCPTPTSCFVAGNVSTVGGGVPGLFKGAWIGTDAYLAYQNSLGGVDGRKFKLIEDDDGLSCETNKADTEALADQVIAFVGSFSLYDSCGGQIFTQRPGLPDVSETLDPSILKLPNVFPVQPAVAGGELGPLEYFKKKFPAAITKVGVLVADVGTAPSQFAGLKAAMEHVGYRIVYEREFSPFDTDYTPDVLRMEQDGVQMVSLVSTNDTYGAKLLQTMYTQGFHPQVIWGGAEIYSGQAADELTVVEAAGGPAVADGVYLEQGSALFLDQDTRLVPEVATFVKWVHGLDPGFNIDLYTLYGWCEAQLFVEALRAAGSNPTQARLLAALGKETSFDAGGLIAPADPAGKKPPTCYLLAQIRNGVFQRVDMPADNEYRCDAGYFDASS